MTRTSQCGCGRRWNKIRVGLTLIRDAEWMTTQRAHAYRNIILVLSVLSVVGIIVLSRNGMDLDGRPIGTDFVSFWTASQIALSGAPSDAYDVGLHWAAQKTLFRDPQLHYTAFLSPCVSANLPAARRAAVLLVSSLLVGSNRIRLLENSQEFLRSVRYEVVTPGLPRCVYKCSARSERVSNNRSIGLLAVGGG